MITLLKLGGSLITDKAKAHTVRAEVLKCAAAEINAALEANPFPLVVGHGSGSFGHVPAKRFNTRNGVATAEDWAGFAEVHKEALDLNHIVTDILRGSGLPALSFVPMDEIRTTNHAITFWNTDSLINAMNHGLIPVIFGDTVFDEAIGGTILSTEDLFTHLCETCSEPPRILLAGLEQGVWQDYPANTKRIKHIAADDSSSDRFIFPSEFTDVTGGMIEKVRLMRSLVRENKASSALIFSGCEEGSLTAALSGENIGTLIS